MKGWPKSKAWLAALARIFFASFRAQAVLGIRQRRSVHDAGLRRHSAKKPVTASQAFDLSG
jgi:hypothetical protein